MSRSLVEQAGGAVAGGLGVVVRDALRLQVLDGGGAAVSERVEVVDLEAEASFAAWFVTAEAVEGRGWSQAERGALLGREVPPVVRDVGELLPVVEHPP